jgi:serine/threonine-protein kinase
VDPETYDLYLRAQALQLRATREAIDEALGLLEEAVRRAPTFASGWSALASALFASSDLGAREPGAAWRRATEAAERAVALGPEEAAGWAVRARIRIGGQDWEGAEADLRRALALEPNRVAALNSRGRLLIALGRPEEAERLAEQATRLDPLAPGSHLTLASARLHRGDYRGSEAEAARALELQPEGLQPARALGFALLLQDRLPEARAAFQRSSAGFYRTMGDAMVSHAEGDDARAQRAFAALLADPRAARGRYQLAQVQAWRGDRDAAFSWLDQAVADHDSSLIHLKGDPFLAGLRGDPRYRALLARLRLPPD